MTFGTNLVPYRGINSAYIGNCVHPFIHRFYFKQHIFNPAVHLIIPIFSSGAE